MKKHTYWSLAIIALLSGVIGAVTNFYFSQSTPTVPSISFRASPNIWELCKQAYTFPHPIPPELLPTEFREYWIQNHMFYVSIGGIHDSHNCVFTRSYEGQFEITVKKKEGK